MTTTSRTVFLLLGLLLAVSVPPAVVLALRACLPAPSAEEAGEEAFRRDLGAVNRHYAEANDDLQAEGADEAGRAAWRQGRNRAVADVYRRHGRPLPRWLRQAEGAAADEER